MLRIFVSLFFLVGCKVSISQTSYGYGKDKENEIEVTVTPGNEKPSNVVDWSGATRDLNNNLQQIERDRQYQRQQLAMEHDKNVAQVAGEFNGRVPSVNSVMLFIQENSIGELNSNYNLLTSGSLRPNRFRTKSRETVNSYQTAKRSYAAFNDYIERYMNSHNVTELDLNKRIAQLLPAAKKAMINQNSSGRDALNLLIERIKAELEKQDPIPAITALSGTQGQNVARGQNGVTESGKSADYSGVADDCKTAKECVERADELLNGEENALLRLAYLDRAVELNDTSRSALWSRGVLKLFELDDNQMGAMADFNKVISLDSTLALAFGLRGMAKLLLGDKRGALVDFDKSIIMDPKLAISYYNRGFLMLQDGEIDKACWDFSKAGELGEERAYAAIKQFCNK